MPSKVVPFVELWDSLAEDLWLSKYEGGLRFQTLA